ncbi:SAM hydrolase/SAM-dependent halogenase family protein [Terrimonas alba]|uniref:SAM hydrolase/SAM-dependent halogenase family protein n=1 Tax=Terrimonas alba TaxID=3349636 RepID=UPI0035F2B8DB
MSRCIIILFLLFTVACQQKDHSKAAVVIQTDFGVKDGAVAAMKGVAYGVSGDIDVFDLTHEIPAYNIWEAAYRLNQVIPFWPANTVFVSVVDPGVGTARKSVVIKTKQGHYIVTPDNGTITLVAESEGIDAVRQIDENLNRRHGSDSSYTFHGRDVYMYTAAKLAAGVIDFEQVGPLLKDSLQLISYQRAQKDSVFLKGNIPVLDPQYGNVWTNIPDNMIKSAGIKSGDTLDVRIAFKDSTVYAGKVPFANTFGDVPEGKPLAYINSLMNFSVAVNRGNFAQSFHVSSGPDWTLSIKTGR